MDTSTKTKLVILNNCTLFDEISNPKQTSRNLCPAGLWRLQKWPRDLACLHKIACTNMHKEPRRGNAQITLLEITLEQEKKIIYGKCSGYLYIGTHF